MSIEVPQHEIDELRANIGRGVALLDRERPGWRGKVDPLKLWMSSFCWCIAGQIGPREKFPCETNHTRYSRALSELGACDIEAEALHGFTLPTYPPPRDATTVDEAKLMSARWDALTELWQEELRGSGQELTAEVEPS